MEIPSSAAGIVKELRVKLGDKVSTGSALLLLEAIAGEGASAAPAASAGQVAAGPAAAAPVATTPVGAAPVSAAYVSAAPVAATQPVSDTDSSVPDQFARCAPGTAPLR